MENSYTEDNRCCLSVTQLQLKILFHNPYFYNLHIYSFYIPMETEIVLPLMKNTSTVTPADSANYNSVNTYITQIKIIMSFPLILHLKIGLLQRQINKG